ncbi:hypothetical protein QE385_003599 [Sphingomonas sp. SORGH_AS 950]|uniref:hypothetical protein n=1 Tax=unclassified Sphingomonas TaxID=196159 RepID=UPI00277EDE14|nr:MULTISPECIES: hypothetical protein [unclassified Sphingomonas]MDQ1159272.1 hypothetical protein [Sphingomonas sp. SORGH_AS_0950]MDR6113073.1 hypothetical protein [Sphingomonas sp. SORGH_AS_0789]MDR6145788.1 hypothetical protein [Sphingomonas sp. SORGH_AS_0870]MDR6149565.1 hypothetical protein [Sphingomonas sp. SORGH_AS_0742]
MSRPLLTSRDWFGKVSAAALLGLTLALALTCLFAALFSTDDGPFSAQKQLAMWLVSPIWCLVLGLCFLFRSGARAWGWLALANLMAWAAYIAARLLLG